MTLITGPDYDDPYESEQMTASLRIPFSKWHKPYEPHEEGVEITDAIAAQIVALTDVLARIAALEKANADGAKLFSDVLAQIQTPRAGLSTISNIMHAHVGPGIAPPQPAPVAAAQPAGDDAAVDALSDVVHLEEDEHWNSPQDEARHILAAIRRGDVPGLCCDNDANALARRLALDVITSTQEVAGLRAKLAEVERCGEIADKLCSAQTAAHDRLTAQVKELTRKLAEAEKANSDLAGRSAYELDRLRGELIAKLYPETATTPILQRLALAAERDRLAAQVAELTRERDEAGAAALGGQTLVDALRASLAAEQKRRGDAEAKYRDHMHRAGGKHEEVRQELIAARAELVGSKNLHAKDVARLAEERDAARAEADALAGLLRECKRYVPWSLESSIDAALAKHGGGK